MEGRSSWALLASDGKTHQSAMGGGGAMMAHRGGALGCGRSVVSHTVLASAL